MERDDKRELVTWLRLMANELEAEMGPDPRGNEKLAPEAPRKTKPAAAAAPAPEGQVGLNAF